MTKQFHREIEKLNTKVLELGEFVERQLEMAMQVLLEKRADLAPLVVQGDSKIDELEVELEEDCLKLLALHQPVATDLRFLISVMKINNDLERIGDLAVDIARRSARLLELGRTEFRPEIHEMYKNSKLMLRKGLLALLNLDKSIAQGVLEADKHLDELNRIVYRAVIEEIKQNPQYAEEEISMMVIARRLERIGDHATNLAEDIIYMTSGDIVRHSWGKTEVKNH